MDVCAAPLEWKEGKRRKGERERNQGKEGGAPEGKKPKEVEVVVVEAALSS